MIMKKIPLLKDFKDETEYIKKLQEFCLKKSIDEVKSHLGEEDLIGIYVKFLETIDEIINSWFEITFELFTIYHPESSIELKDLESFQTLVTTDKKKLDKLYNDDFKSMGFEFSKKDIEILKSSIKELQSLIERKIIFEKRTKELGKKIAPITCKIAGELVTAKLLSLSKGLRKLMLMPSSTIQVLGAEKALFRHLITNKRARPPKHGVIFYSDWILLTKDNNRGKMARALASKLAITSKLDYFKGKDISTSLNNDLNKKRDGLK